MLLTVETLLDQVQQLIGEPVGGYYNISQRLAQLSQAQMELVDETSAIQENVELEVTANVAEVELPVDFQRLGDRLPLYIPDSGNYGYPVEVVPPRKLDYELPGWRRGNSVGTPRYAVQEGTSLILYPVPRDSGKLDLNYVAIPEPLVSLDQVPFNGRRDLNRFAMALAYKVAFLVVIARAPELGSYYKRLYDEEERKLRHYVRSNGQKAQVTYFYRKPRPAPIYYPPPVPGPDPDPDSGPDPGPEP